MLSGGVEGFLETNYEMVEGTNVPEKPKPAAKGAKKKSGVEMITTQKSIRTKK